MKRELKGSSIILKNAKRRLSRERKIRALMDFYGITAKEAIEQLKDMGEY